MEIIKDYPPNYKDIAAAFDLTDALSSGVVFTYGPTIYNPTGVPLTENLIAHEQVHEQQQKYYDGGPAAWWDRYLVDPEFRCAQELEAYATQYAWFLSERARYDKLRVRNPYSATQMDYYLDGMAHSLASPMYGNLMSWAEARSKIRNAAKDVIAATTL